MALRARTNKKVLGELPTNTAAAPEVDVRNVQPEYWLKKYRGVISSFVFFLDMPDTSAKKELIRKLELLNVKCEFFLSKKCTHIITSKAFHEPFVNSADDTPDALNQENKPTEQPETHTEKKRLRAKDPAQQEFFDGLMQLNAEVWSLTKSNCIVHALIHKNNKASQSRRVRPDNNLEKILMDEKKFGLSTSQLEKHDSRPQFVPFKGYYCLVEDVTGVHRPIAVREYPRPDMSIPPKNRLYHWPCLKLTDDANSPFPMIESTVPPGAPGAAAAANTDANAAKPQQPHGRAVDTSAHRQQQQQQQQQQQPSQNASLQADPSAPPAAATAQAPQGPTPMEVDTPHASGGGDAPLASIDISLVSKTQGHTTTHLTSTANTAMTMTHPTTMPTTTTTTTTLATPGTASGSKPWQKGFAAPGARRTATATMLDNFSRMDRRTISHTAPKPANHDNGDASDMAKTGDKRLATAPRPAKRAKLNHNRDERQILQMQRQRALANGKYCENCHVHFQQYYQHYASESHQAFLRDKNNFKPLDDLLRSLQRTPRTS
ncbi:hypothetical protein BC940DRAFT_363776 [Gongronella butleri]|nr:hypothetical protein BC940DRAFT_363776 [Gongronella butleri]